VVAKKKVLVFFTVQLIIGNREKIIFESNIKKKNDVHAVYWSLTLSFRKFN
jgi:hypothetical protein